MIPTIGRIVHYTLSGQDAFQINSHAIGSLTANPVREGEVFPMMIVRVWSESMVQGQVFIDGNFTFWATSVSEGEGPRTYAWPTKD